MYLFFDTETTGLPKGNNYDAAITETDVWPRLVELAWIIYDADFKPRASHDFIILRDEFDIPDSASKIHGIYDKDSDKYGHKIAPVLQLFGKDVVKCKYVVGHNVSFDVNVVGCEMARLKWTDWVERLPHFPQLCTMKAGTPVCKIKGAYNRFKWPKLEELYKHLFNEDLEDAHNALVDIQATARCFFELHKKGHIKELI